MENYQIKNGFEQMDIKAVYRYLNQQSYWAENIPYPTVETALKNSFCVGVFTQGQQIGFARLVTDYATFAYLADVYILEEHRQKGLSKALMNHIMALDWVSRLRRITLATWDAHGLYSQYGFTAPENPEHLMEIRRKDIYKKD